MTIIVSRAFIVVILKRTPASHQVILLIKDSAAILSLSILSAPVVFLAIGVLFLALVAILAEIGILLINQAMGLRGLHNRTAIIICLLRSGIHGELKALGWPRIALDTLFVSRVLFLCRLLLYLALRLFMSFRLLITHSFLYRFLHALLSLRMHTLLMRLLGRYLNKALLACFPFLTSNTSWWCLRGGEFLLRKPRLNLLLPCR